MHTALGSCSVRTKGLGVQTHMLHADDLLASILGNGVPDCHVVGGQMQLVGTGQRIVTGEGSARVGIGSSSRWKMTR